MTNIPAWASGQLRSYARDPEIWAALESRPGFSDAVAVADEASAMLDSLTQKRAELTDGLTPETILGTGKIPPSWLDSIAAKAVEREAVKLQIDAVTSLRSVAHDKVQNLVTESGEEILAVLGERMTAVVDKLQAAVKELGAANDPLEAIRLGAGEAWLKVEEARKEYGRLRAAQTTVHTSSGSRWAETWQRAKKGKAGGRDIPYSSYAIIKNLDEVFPNFGYSHEDGFSPWTVDIDFFLVEIVKRGGALWVPTERELSAHLAERRDFFEREFHAAKTLWTRSPGEYEQRMNAGEFHPAVTLRVRDECR
ncbi:hypothetical protein ACFVAV_23360 [Nocardia sp. NPDC057663]|uniref:hypothetical protein n=1 Tax=Nocardia sp. NPDC057663 TaxID=3346201 RepID=UPI00366F8590